MARSTFAGPILSGDQRFGPVRNVGYTDLVQGIDLNFGNTGGNGTAGYPGASGQFVNGNLIPNVNATVYTPSSTVYPPAAASITADTTSAIYRGAVFYLPTGCNINDVIIDVGTAVSVTGTTPAYAVKVGNQFNGSQYASCTLSSTGRQTVTYSGAQVTAIQSTTADFTNPTGVVEPATFSQVVFTLAITGGSSDLVASSLAGVIYFTVRYTQPDNNIGNTTTYPYGNFD
jgi:hypothetical protein